MNSIKIIALVLIGMSLLACQSKPSSETTDHSTDSANGATSKSQAVADLEKQILATHDSVMPAMSDLMKLKKDVSSTLAELNNQPATDQNRRQKEQALAIRTSLEKADESMMSWMNHYNGDTLAKLNQEQALAYLSAEQKRVNAMSQLMRKSIVDAQTYLKSR